MVKQGQFRTCCRLSQKVSLLLLFWLLVANGDDVEDEEKMILVNDDEAFGVSGNKLSVGVVGEIPEWDSYGYVMYCPCMGRFGNQAEHFLGSLAFAITLNRTLVVPPWRTYRNVPYSDFFKLEDLKKSHKVVLMEDFIEHLAPKFWSPGKRRGYCWLPQNSDQQCKMKEGNPFGPFWDAFNVDFDEYVIYHINTNVDISSSNKAMIKEQWYKQYPPTSHPVLSFKGAPASFPVQRGNWKLHEYMKWSDNIMQEVQTHIDVLFHGQMYVGIHLRNGVDWERACEYAEGNHNLMASPQCLLPGQLLSRAMCYPSTKTVLETTKSVVMAIDAKHVYIATDNDPLQEELHDYLQPLGVKVHHLNPALPQIDLAILGQSDYFIGNCVSSFSSFVKRDRDTNGQNKPTTYWGFELE